MTISSSSADPAKVSFPRKRPRHQVETVVASTGFPMSGKGRAAAEAARAKAATHVTPQGNTTLKTPTAATPTDKHKTKLLDWHATAKEVRQLGATGFDKKQKRDYEDEEYKRLTGRERKKQKIPLPIVRGLQKAAAKREAKALEEARAAGKVVPSSSLKSKKTATSRSRYNNPYSKHGPAPSIGFVKHGILQLKKKPV